MVAVSRFAAYAGVCGWLMAGVAPALAGSGQDFPNVTCACKGCGQNKSDVIGKCPDVCKDKTVYNKGEKVVPAAPARQRPARRDKTAKAADPTEFCKAARMKLPKGWMRADPPSAQSR
ncbi:MAG: hypothetical protein FJX45_12075 [Alphaproteobacteria bacterium]|nr:hypothetical protein [Alphaproteobacteria bacterium]MBM3653936.1 hypothetical protein [Alphaproteobacteria bacterium]